MMTRIERTTSFAGNQSVTFDYGVSALPKKQQSTLRQQQETVQILQKNLSLFDRDGNKQLTKAELQAAIKDLPKIQEQLAKLQKQSETSTTQDKKPPTLSAEALGDIASYFDPLMYSHRDLGPESSFTLSASGQNAKGRKDDLSTIADGLKDGKDLKTQADDAIQSAIGTGRQLKGDEAFKVFSQQLTADRQRILASDGSGLDDFQMPGSDDYGKYDSVAEFLADLEGGAAAFYKETGWPETDKPDGDKKTKDTVKDEKVSFSVTIGNGEDEAIESGKSGSKAQHAAWTTAQGSPTTSDTDWEIQPVKADDSNVDSKTITEKEETPDVWKENGIKPDKKETQVAFNVAEKPEMRFRGWNGYQKESPSRDPKSDSATEMLADASFMANQRSDWTIDPNNTFTV